MKKIFFSLSLFVMLFLPSFANSKIKVIKVYDGDSVLAKIDDNIFRIRLIGIDCFEGKPSERAKWQAKNNNLSIEKIIQGGNLAKTILSQKIINKMVEFEFRGIDKYNRALGIIYDKNININEEMLETPYCSKYKKFK